MEDPTSWYLGEGLTQSMQLNSGKKNVFSFLSVRFEFRSNAKHFGTDITHCEWNPLTISWNVVASAANREVVVWDVETSSSKCTPVIKYGNHARPVSGISWHQDDFNLLASSSMDRHIYLWDVRTNQPTQTIKQYTGFGEECDWFWSSDNIFCCSSIPYQIWQNGKELFFDDSFDRN